MLYYAEFWFRKLLQRIYQHYFCFSGATTGTGGRLRDVHAVGRGGHYIAGTAGYSVGNLLIQGKVILQLHFFHFSFL